MHKLQSICCNMSGRSHTRGETLRACEKNSELKRLFWLRTIERYYLKSLINFGYFRCLVMTADSQYVGVLGLVWPIQARQDANLTSLWEKQSIWTVISMWKEQIAALSWKELFFIFFAVTSKMHLVLHVEGPIVYPTTSMSVSISHHCVRKPMNYNELYDLIR